MRQIPRFSGQDHPQIDHRIQGLPAMRARWKVTTGIITFFPRGLGATARRTGIGDGRTSNRLTLSARQRHTTVHSYREHTVSMRAEGAKYCLLFLALAPVSRGDQS
ncbi:hypothetical protein [Ruegeria sp. HKCCD8929]|uniref:hypothetical protein n=1 Tax=Ruegeria sp. HKCCD8929 TaxID=2683006 RepID=UPI00148778A6|nr:hypothetical protein [Ruegeria sp. HKCCD8929]